MFMKRTVQPIIILCMALSAKALENVTVPTSSMQKLGMTEDKEMKEFVEEAYKEYYEFRKECFEEYIEFARDAWKWVDLEPALPYPKEVEYVPEILNDDPLTDSWLSRQATNLKNKILGIFNSKKKKEQAADTMPNAAAPDKKPNVSVEVKNFVKVNPLKEKYSQPQPIHPIGSFKEKENPYYTFTSFGTEYKVRIGDNCRFKLMQVCKSDIIDEFKKLFSPQFDNVIHDCLKARKEHHLSDWAYLQMLCSLVDSFYGVDTPEANIALAFIYMQSGYKVRLAHDDNKVFLLIASRHAIAGNPRYRVEGETFNVFRNNDVRKLCICDTPYMKEQGMSLVIPEVQDFAVTASEPKEYSSNKYPDFSFKVNVNKNLIDFFNTYPCSTVDGDFTTKWLMYAKTPISEEVKNQLYPQMRAKLDGLPEVEAVNRLLNWVQSAFKYEYDNVVWGYDRPFFAEETLFYPKSDCEDHAILFAHLVKDVLGLNVALVYLRNHLASAVEFTDRVEGNCFIVDGHRYVFCDPTLLFGDVGEAGSNTFEESRVILLSREL